MSASTSNKERYNSLNTFLKNKFGCKVFKVSLDGFFTCPNRDGTKGFDGCIYCNPESNFTTVPSTGKTIKEQLVDGIEYVKKRHKAAKFISYFQQYSNTYAPSEKLEELYNEAIDHPDVLGLAISTRPDCLNSEVFRILGELNKKTFLWLELGLQSPHEKTLKLINRGHTKKEFEEAVLAAKKLKIMTCAHIIIGLPGETKKEILFTASYLNKIGIDGVKIHNLHILKNTKLAEFHERGEVTPLTQSEYANLVVDFVERLDPTIIIHRLNSHSPRQLTIAPKWSVNKMGTINEIEKEFKKRNTWQGKLAHS